MNDINEYILSDIGNILIDYLYQIRDNNNRQAHLEEEYGHIIKMKLKEMIKIVENEEIVIKNKNKDGKEYYSIITIKDCLRHFFDAEELEEEIVLDFYDEKIQKKMKEIRDDKEKKNSEK